MIQQSWLPVWDVVSSFDWTDKKEKSRSLSNQALPIQWVNKDSGPLSDLISHPALHILTPQSGTSLPNLEKGWLSLAVLLWKTQIKQSIIIITDSTTFFFFNRQILVMPGIKTFQCLSHGDQYKITSKLLISKKLTSIYSVCLWVHESVIEGKIKFFGRFPYNLV